MGRIDAAQEAKRLLALLENQRAAPRTKKEVLCRSCFMSVSELDSFREYDEDDQPLGYVCFECAGA